MASCIETMSCFPEKPLDVFRFFEYQYSIPTVVILALFVGIFIAAIYMRTRSLAHLIVLSVYSFAVFGTMWASDAFLEEQYQMVVYIIALAIASVVVLVLLRLVKE